MPEGSNTTTALWVFLAAVAAAMIAALWLIGALAAELFGGGWTTVDPAQLVAVVFRLPDHLGDPRRAWPRPARSAMPGAAGIYTTAVLVLGGIGALMALVLDAARARGWMEHVGRGSRRPTSARWARSRDLRALMVRGPERGRLIIGRAFGRLIAAEPRQSVIVFAPTGSHKTVGLAIPALREWDGPVIATSVKTDLVARTLSQRRERGSVAIFDPARVTSFPRTRMSPLMGCEEWRGAVRVAHWLTRAAQTAGAGIENADFWYMTAERMLAPLLFAAASSEQTMADVVRWVEEGKGAIKEVNAALGAAGEQRAERAWSASWEREERQRSSVRTTAESIVGAFGDPFVAGETSGAAYTPGDLFDGGCNTLYLCAPETEQERLQPVFSTQVQQFLDAAYARAAGTPGGVLDPPLLLLLDEAANIAPIPNLAGIASTGAGQGIQLLTVFQDFAQIRSVYGDGANTIVNNHRGKLFGRGVSDPEALTYIANVTGLAEFEERSRTAGETGQSSTTERSSYHALAPANEVREAEEETALLIYGGVPVTRVSLRPYYKERTLIRSRANTTVSRLRGRQGSKA